MAYVDKNMLETVLRNIVSNAIKFTPRGGAITLKASSKDKLTLIEVRDSGVGMSPYILKSLFLLDQKIKQKGTENEPGTGLGLLLCKELLHKNNGSIYVESIEGEGSVFYLELPAHQ